MRRSMGDRRQRPRFDVVGQLAGTLDAAVSMALRDVGRGGAQVESFVKLAAGSLHRATFNCDGIEAAVQVCVRHVEAGRLQHRRAALPRSASSSWARRRRCSS